MPVTNSKTPKHPRPDGSVVTITVRHGTRRRQGELNRYVLGRSKSYSTTTTRTRLRDGTVTTSTRGTYVGVKAVLVLLVLAIGGIAAALGIGADQSNTAGHTASTPAKPAPKPAAVPSPPAPPPGYSQLLFKYAAPAGAFDPSAGQANLTLSGLPSRPATTWDRTRSAAAASA